MYVGLMSGTSLDGIDAVLAKFSAAGARCIATCYYPYPDDVRAEVLALHDTGGDELRRASLLANRLAEAYGWCVSDLLVQSHVKTGDVVAIGCHGQTIRHAPSDGYSIQLNNPARLAEITGITVVSDFRSRDIAAGGQGAPLVPAFHNQAFRANSCHRIILNIGGIANVTDLAPGRPTAGFDCGPGNMLLDAWALRKLGQPFDENGQWGLQGREISSLLARLLSHPFFSNSPPKSCGREQFNLEWLEYLLEGNEKAEDVQATLAALTVTTVTDAIGKWCGTPDELYVCGGGAHNTAIMKGLASRLDKTRVGTTADLGILPDWVEAVAFAWLAQQTMLHQTGNLPAVTGAKGERILGAIYPA